MVVERPGLRGRVIAAVGAVDARGGVQMGDCTVKSFKRDASGLGNCTLEFLCRVSGDTERRGWLEAYPSVAELDIERIAVEAKVSISGSILGTGRLTGRIL